MAEKENNTQQTAAQQPQAAPQQRQARPCPKDCSRCGYQQHAYCAARMSFQMFEVMNAVIQRLDAQSQRLADIERRIAAIESSEAEFSSPSPIEDGLLTRQDAGDK